MIKKKNQQPTDPVWALHELPTGKRWVCQQNQNAVVAMNLDATEYMALDVSSGEFGLFQKLSAAKKAALDMVYTTYE